SDHGIGTALYGAECQLQAFMSASWHRRHFRGGGFRLPERQARQYFDPLEYLFGIESTFTGQPSTMAPIEVLPPALSTDLPGEAVGNASPNRATDHVIHGRQRGSTPAQHDRVVFGMRVGVAGQNIENHDV